MKWDGKSCTYTDIMETLATIAKAQQPKRIRATRETRLPRKVKRCK